MRETYDKQRHGCNSGSIYRSSRPHTGGKIHSSCLLLCHPLLHLHMEYAHGADPEE